VPIELGNAAEPFLPGPFDAVRHTHQASQLIRSDHARGAALLELWRHVDAVGMVAIPTRDAAGGLADVQQARNGLPRQVDQDVRHPLDRGRVAFAGPDPDADDGDGLAVLAPALVFAQAV